MRYFRLFSVLVLLGVTVTGCHRKVEQAVVPVQAQPPIVTTLPPMPPLTFPDVQLAKPEPVVPVQQAEETPAPVKTPRKHVRHRRARQKASPDTTTGTAVASNAEPPAANGAATPASGTSILGQLSASDAGTNPNLAQQTKKLIESIEEHLKKMSKPAREKHKDDVAQAELFLTQAKQAMAMNDVVGAQTLANKAKILLDELPK